MLRHFDELGKGHGKEHERIKEEFKRQIIGEMFRSIERTLEEIAGYAYRDDIPDRVREVYEAAKAGVGRYKATVLEDAEELKSK